MTKFDLDLAIQFDKEDPFSEFRSLFHIPIRNGKDSVYFCGNSLGLQPKSVKQYIEVELNSWSKDGVEGHFSGTNPWIDYHHKSKDALSRLVGAKKAEVVSMNNLTTNLHLMLASFYRPIGNRTKILIESGAFPSDHYAAESHMRRLGLNPSDNLVAIAPNNGDFFETEEIVKAITSLGDDLALVLWPGIQYYTGQFFDLKSITKAAHNVGAYAGFDLAHAMGNLPMNLHDDEVDFAAWCSYKYLNSGPGGVSGVFVHERHSSDPDFPKLTGWWGHEKGSRFAMDNKFKAAPGADAWMLSNMNILSMAAHCASLEIFQKASIDHLRIKSIKLTSYLETLLTEDQSIHERIKILTPKDPDQRGCQLSIFLLSDGKEVFDQLIANGVILDWREPNVIRVAPVPLYNTFEDVWRFYSILKRIFANQ